jgi:hypothetical protein
MPTDVRSNKHRISNHSPSADVMTLLNQAKQTQPPSEQTLIGNISAEFYSKSGHAQAELMNYHEAVSDWTAVISHKPDYAVAYKLSRTCET